MKNGIIHYGDTIKRSGPVEEAWQAKWIWDGDNITMHNWLCLRKKVSLTTVPKTNTDPERTGMILDYLAYQSYISLMEPYYDSFLTQKGARNEDSAEMLSIIRDTRDVNLGYLFGWSNSMEEPIREQLMKGSTEIASIIAKYQSKVQTAIDKSMNKIMENE